MKISSSQSRLVHALIWPEVCDEPRLSREINMGRFECLRGLESFLEKMLPPLRQAFIRESEVFPCLEMIEYDEVLNFF